MLECKYQHLLDPRLYSCSGVARFLDALNQPEINSASSAALQHFVDRIPALDDILDHLYDVEDKARADLAINGSLRPYASILSPHGETRYHIYNLGKRNPSRVVQDVLTTCKALAFCSSAYCVLLVFHEDMIDRIKINGNCMRGSAIQSTIDVTYGASSVQYETERNIGHKAKPYDRCHFCEVKDGNEMLEILKRVLTISRLSSVENLPQLNEYDVLLNFAISMKAMSIFSR